MLKRIFSLLLSAILAATFMASAVLADGPPTLEDGIYKHIEDSASCMYIGYVNLLDSAYFVLQGNSLKTFFDYQNKTYEIEGKLAKVEPTPGSHNSDDYTFTYENMSSFDVTSMEISYYPNNTSGSDFSVLLYANVPEIAEDDLVCEMHVKRTGPITPTDPIIPNGRYGGTGTAAVDVVFGKWNIATLPLINATITDANLTLSFRANKIDYLVTAPRVSVASDGTATYHVVEGERTWDISIDPSGTLTGKVEYSGDKGVMDFTMALVTK